MWIGMHDIICFIQQLSAMMLDVGCSKIQNTFLDIRKISTAHILATIMLPSFTHLEPQPSGFSFDRPVEALDIHTQVEHTVPQWASPDGMRWYANCTAVSRPSGVRIFSKRDSRSMSNSAALLPRSLKAEAMLPTPEKYSTQVRGSMMCPEWCSQYKTFKMTIWDTHRKHVLELGSREAPLASIMRIVVQQLAWDATLFQR